MAKTTKGGLGKGLGSLMGGSYEEVSKIQDKYNEYINSSKLDEILDAGRDKTREIAKAKYEEARRKMGLGR